jgi:hypothetical protein
LSDHTGAVSSLAFYGDELIGGSFDRSFRFWDYRAGPCTRVGRSPRPYEDTDITGVKGLTEFQKARMKVLGARERNAG